MNILEQLAKSLSQRTPIAGSDFFGITRTEREVIISTLREFSNRPEEKLAEWISPEPTQAMIDSVSTILQPYAAKLVWARMLKAALLPQKSE